MILVRWYRRWLWRGPLGEGRAMPLRKRVWLWVMSHDWRRFEDDPDFCPVRFREHVLLICAVLAVVAGCVLLVLLVRREL